MEQYPTSSKQTRAHARTHPPLQPKKHAHIAPHTSKMYYLLLLYPIYNFVIKITYVHHLWTKIMMFMPKHAFVLIIRN